MSSGLQVINGGSSGTFDAATYATLQFNLNQDATLDISGAKTGILYTFILKQDSNGGHTWIWPNAINNGITVNGEPYSVTVQTFVLLGDANFYPIAGLESIATPIQGVFGGIGPPGATATVIVSGTTATLSNGTILNQLQTTAEAVGSQWTFSNLNNQTVYLLLRNGGHTFIDARTGLPQPFVYAMNAPLTVTVNGVILYLYASTNSLYGNTIPKIAS